MKDVQLTFKMSPKVRDRIERLKGKTEATSMVEVIRNALAVYECLVNSSQAGGTVLVRSPDGNERELLLFPSEKAQ